MKMNDHISVKDTLKEGELSFLRGDIEKQRNVLKKF